MQIFDSIFFGEKKPGGTKHTGIGGAQGHWAMSVLKLIGFWVLRDISSRPHDK